MERQCDLHTHSTFSDGTYTPTQLVDEAVRAGLAAVALTDHNTVAGLTEFTAAAESRPVRAIPGVEISTEYAGRELHIVGLFLPPESYAAVMAYVDTARIRKEESNRALVAALTAHEYALDYEDICRRSAGYVNRANIAAVMVEKGYVADTGEAFRRVLSPEAGFYVPPARLDALETVAFLRRLGSVPVWAHPYLSVPAETVPVIAAEAKACGLMAMETRYARYTPEVTKEASRVARETGLLESGGSDFHGGNKPDISLGRGLGDLCVPLSFLERLEAE